MTGGSVGAGPCSQWCGTGSRVVFRRTKHLLPRSAKRPIVLVSGCSAIWPDVPARSGALLRQRRLATESEVEVVPNGRFARAHHHVSRPANFKCLAHIDQLTTPRPVILAGDAEQAGNEVRLTDRIAFGQPPDASLVDHVHRFDSLQRPPRALKTRRIL